MFFQALVRDHDEGGVLCCYITLKWCSCGRCSVNFRLEGDTEDGGVANVICKFQWYWKRGGVLCLESKYRFKYVVVEVVGGAQ